MILRKTGLIITYWHWFFKGSGGSPGFRRIINSWLLLHILIGSLLAHYIKLDIAACANTVLLPLIGVLVGLTFAWAGNAQPLMRSDEIGLLTDHHKGGFAEYVYVFQTAILVLLITVIAWALAGLKIFDQHLPTMAMSQYYFSVKAALFTFVSLAVKACWNLVMGVQLMLIAQRKMKDL